MRLTLASLCLALAFTTGAAADDKEECVKFGKYVDNRINMINSVRKDAIANAESSVGKGQQLDAMTVEISKAAKENADRFMAEMNPIIVKCGKAMSCPAAQRGIEGKTAPASATNSYEGMMQYFITTCGR